jgi:cytochrome oxidase Cu insertion factor (SCO1/SenC/PrrC family)/mono/diheme cytochrome c family protein
MTHHRIRAALPPLAVAALAALAADPGRAARWDESYFPNVPLVTQAGETVRFYDDLIDGKIAVVNFVYTDCPDICGLSTARMAQVYDWLGDRVGRDIFIYSISLDPETDTPERLDAYARAFGAGEGWLFLTGTRDDIDLVRYKLGERSRSLAEHRSDMVVGNDATGEWRRMSLMGSLVVATQEILEMDPDWRPPAVPARPAAPGGYVLEDTPGEALFLKACAACHTVGAGVRIGPDLAGVTLRRDRDWLVRYLMAPDAMLASGDPVAVALDARFASVRMPNLRLGETDAEDLIRYLQAETDRLDAEAAVTEAAAGHHHDHAHDHGAHDHGSHDHGTHDH